MILNHLTLVAGLVATTASASFDGNINYASPSRRHDWLGLDVAHIQRRSWKRQNVQYKPADLKFTHGVASGDPWPNSVILWTRVAPSNASSKSNRPVSGTAPIYDHDDEKYIKADANPICVEWSVYASAGPTANATTGAAVASGKAYTTSDIDFTVKVEATGLQPFTPYDYQFTVCDSNVKSTVGHTKTAPGPDDDVSNISFAVFSCSNYPNGYFNAYGNAARKNVQDYNLHLGDYIYEGGQTDKDRDGKRDSAPQDEIFTLHDYRTRHGQYRSDPDLQLLTERSPWITVWDDHEFAHNGYRDGFSNLNNTEQSFKAKGGKATVDARKANAVRAYFEWIPIRVTDMDDGLRVWRSFKMGKLLDLIMIDTRNYDRSITSLGWNDKYIDLIRDEPSRTLMGSRQEKWFYRSLSESQARGAKWRIVGNQIVFSHIQSNAAGAMSGDTWMGYLANRNRTLQHLYDNKLTNNIFLAGDSHQNWVADLAWSGVKDYDSKTGAGAVGVEFAGTAVSSSGIKGTIEPAAGDNARTFIKLNQELQWKEGYYRGYFFLKVGPEEAKAEFYGSPTVSTRNAWDLPLANFTVKAGDSHLSRPIAGGKVESGALRGGDVKHTNLTLNTNTNEWKVVGFNKMYLK